MASKRKTLTDTKLGEHFVDIQIFLA